MYAHLLLGTIVPSLTLVVARSLCVLCSSWRSRARPFARPVCSPRLLAPFAGPLCSPACSPALSTLDETFLERDRLNAQIVEAINAAASDWGIVCKRYEIRDIAPPQAVRVAMEMQAEAERRKRALILDSQGEQEAEVNLATGRKSAQVLASEGLMQERINLAKGEAAAIEAHAEASAKAVRVLAHALQQHGGAESASLRVAEQYVAAFSKLAASGSMVVVPANTGDVGAMIAQAMAVYKASAAGPVLGGGLGRDSRGLGTAGGERLGVSAGAGSADQGQRGGVTSDFPETVDELAARDAEGGSRDERHGDK